MLSWRFCNGGTGMSSLLVPLSFLERNGGCTYKNDPCITPMKQDYNSGWIASVKRCDPASALCHYITVDGYTEQQILTEDKCCVPAFSLRLHAATTPATTAPDTTTEASTTAQTSTTTSTGAAQTVRQDFECHKNYMFVFIPVDLVPNSQLTLRDPNCRLINNGTHHKISLDYDECGTSQSFYTDHISVENDVNVHSIFNDTEEITFVEDYKIPLRCSVDRSKLVNGVIQVMPRESVQESVVQSSEFNMKEFTTKDYNQEITEYPVKLPINREIFFEIALTNRSSDSAGIFVEKCEATPSTNPDDTVHVSLIHFGCSVIPAVKVLPAPGIDRFRFSFQAFHFSAPSNDSNLVYVHCSASTCGGILCDNACPQSSRRRKRSARGRASATLTSGSHVVS